MKIALVVIAYNRLVSVERLIKSLLRADYDDSNVDLIISIDKSKTSIVEDFADRVIWPFGEKRVIKHYENLGLRKHIMSQGKHFDKYDALVILEDDLVVSPCFFYYVNQTVAKYSNDKRIAGISLYSYHMNYQRQFPFEPIKTEYDAYFMKCAMSWGQIWLKNQWEDFYVWYQNNLNFDYTAEMPRSLYTWPDSSWLKYHIRYCIEKERYFVYPYVSLTTDYSDVGTHNNDANNTTVYQVGLQRGNKKSYNLPDLTDEAVKYDGFFENEVLYSTLNMTPQNCSLDIVGGNGNQSKKRFWLTTAKAPFKVVSSWGMRMRPIEINIIDNVPGNDIFLYDTSEKSHNGKVIDSKNVILFNYRLPNMFSLMRVYGIKSFYLDPVKSLFHKVAIKIGNKKK